MVSSDSTGILFNRVRGHSVIITAFSVRSSCFLFLVVVNIVVLSYQVLCPVRWPVSDSRSIMYVGEVSRVVV